MFSDSFPIWLKLGRRTLLFCLTAPPSSKCTITQGKSSFFVTHKNITQSSLSNEAGSHYLFISCPNVNNDLTALVSFYCKHALSLWGHLREHTERPESRHSAQTINTPRPKRTPRNTQTCLCLHPLHIWQPPTQPSCGSLIPEVNDPQNWQASEPGCSRDLLLNLSTTNSDRSTTLTRHNRCIKLQPKPRSHVVCASLCGCFASVNIFPRCFASLWRCFASIWGHFASLSICFPSLFRHFCISQCVLHVQGPPWPSRTLGLCPVSLFSDRAMVCEDLQW